MKIWRSALARVLAVSMVGIIFPTGFLLYLGVVSVREETLLLAKESEERVGKTLQGMQEQASAIIDGSRKFADGLTPQAITSKPPGVSFLLALNANHYLLYPIREGPEQRERRRPFLQVTYQQALQAAEHAEANDRDYARAQDAYQTLARQVNSPYWKIKFLLAAANCLVKLGREDAAEAQYQEILSRYSMEMDEMGRPFGLLIITQLADLQMQEDRRPMALANELNAYQDLLNGKWKLSWEDEQFFARGLQERLTDLGSLMSPAEHRQFAHLNAAWRLKEASANQAREFIAKRWGPIQSRLIEQGVSERPMLLFDGTEMNQGLWVIPSRNRLTGERRGWIIAEIACRELWAQIGGTLDELSGASRAAYRLSMNQVLLVGSRQEPENSRYPLLARMTQTLPTLTVEVGQLSNMPIQRLAERRRQIYMSVVALAAVVILVAFYATWHALSREVQLAELKSRFVASVSHELKTPLSIIGLIGQGLKLGRYQSQAQAQEYYGILAEETDRLKSLIDDVLDFSRLLENRQPYHRVSTDLVGLIRESIDRCRRMHPQKNLTIAFEHSENPCQVQLDRKAMGRVVLNLLDNAVKYSSPDRTRISVSLRRETGQVVLAVADEGFGIAPDELALVFDRFYRGKSSMSHHKTNGVGLGLSIAQQIVQAHQGTLTGESTEETGSVFTIRLPAEDTA